MQAEMKMNVVHVNHEKSSSHSRDLHPICKLKRKHELRMMEIKLWLKTRKQHFHISQRLSHIVCEQPVLFAASKRSGWELENEKWWNIHRLLEKLPSIWILDLHIIKNHLYFTRAKKKKTAPKESLEFPRSCWRINFSTETATLAVWAVNFSSFYQVLLKLSRVSSHFQRTKKKERRRRVKAWSFVLWYWEAYYQHVVSRLLGWVAAHTMRQAGRGWRAKKIEYYANFMGKFRLALYSIYLSKLVKKRTHGANWSDVCHKEVRVKVLKKLNFFIVSSAMMFDVLSLRVSNGNSYGLSCNSPSMKLNTRLVRTWVICYWCKRVKILQTKLMVIAAVTAQ